MAKNKGYDDSSSADTSTDETLSSSADNALVTGEQTLPGRSYGHEREAGLEGRVKALEDAATRSDGGDLEKRVAFLEKHLGVGT